MVVGYGMVVACMGHDAQCIQISQRQPWRQTEDLKVLCSIHSQGTMHLLIHRNQTRSPIVWLTNSNKHIQTYLDIMLNLEK
jgi:hypothetical protein